MSHAVNNPTARTAVSVHHLIAFVKCSPKRFLASDHRPIPVAHASRGRPQPMNPPQQRDTPHLPRPFRNAGTVTLFHYKIERNSPLAPPPLPTFPTSSPPTPLFSPAPPPPSPTFLSRSTSTPSPSHYPSPLLHLPPSPSPPSPLLTLHNPTTPIFLISSPHLTPPTLHFPPFTPLPFPYHLSPTIPPHHISLLPLTPLSHLLIFSPPSPHPLTLPSLPPPPLSYLPSLLLTTPPLLSTFSSTTSPLSPPTTLTPHSPTSPPPPSSPPPLSSLPLKSDSPARRLPLRHARRACAVSAFPAPRSCAGPTLRVSQTLEPITESWPITVLPPSTVALA